MRVVVTDKRPDMEGRYEEGPYRDAVEAIGGEVAYAECMTEKDVVEACQNADIIVTSKAPITRNVIEQVGNIKLIQRQGVGYDNINVKAATEYGIPVSNAPGICDDEIATHSITLMLSAAHEVTLSDRDMQKSNGWGERRPINVPTGGTFGIIGLGRIGRATIEKAKGFDMDIIAFDPYLPDDLFDALDVKRVTLDELLEQSDCVSVHTPLTAETHHLLSTEEFRRMKDTAIVVNTARGPIIDMDALVDAVENGELWGAGLDVFETEPPVDSPAFTTDKIVCSPHHAGFTPAVDRRCFETVRDEIVRAIEGEPLRNVVNPGALQWTDDILSPERDEWKIQ